MRPTTRGRRPRAGPRRRSTRAGPSARPPTTARPPAGRAPAPRRSRASVALRRHVRLGRRATASTTGARLRPPASGLDRRHLGTAAGTRLRPPRCRGQPPTRPLRRSTARQRRLGISHDHGGGRPDAHTGPSHTPTGDRRRRDARCLDGERGLAPGPRPEAAQPVEGGRNGLGLAPEDDRRDQDDEGQRAQRQDDVADPAIGDGVADLVRDRRRRRRRRCGDRGLDGWCGRLDGRGRSGAGGRNGRRGLRGTARRGGHRCEPDAHRSDERRDGEQEGQHPRRPAPCPPLHEGRSLARAELTAGAPGTSRSCVRRWCAAPAGSRPAGTPRPAHGPPAGRPCGCHPGP